MTILVENHGQVGISAVLWKTHPQRPLGRVRIEEIDCSNTGEVNVETKMNNTVNISNIYL